MFFNSNKIKSKGNRLFIYLNKFSDSLFFEELKYFHIMLHLTTNPLRSQFQKSRHAG